MSVVNISGTAVSQASYKKARGLAADKKESGATKSASSVMESIRQMMPGWNVSTNPAELRGNGMRNLEIAPSVLERMAEDPEELVRFKAIILDLEQVVQELEHSFTDENDVNKLILQIIVDADGNISARGAARTSDGAIRRREFDMSERDLPSWAELLRKHMDDMRSGNEEEDGTRSWLG